MIYFTFLLFRAGANYLFRVFGQSAGRREFFSRKEENEIPFPEADNIISLTGRRSARDCCATTEKRLKNCSKDSNQAKNGRYPGFEPEVKKFKPIENLHLIPELAKTI